MSCLLQNTCPELWCNSALTGLYNKLQPFPTYGVRYIAGNDNYDNIDPNSASILFCGH